MKKTLLLLVLAGIFSLGSAQSWISSNNIYGDNDIGIINSAIDPNNDIISLGHFMGTLSTGTGEGFTAYGGRDLFVAKFDEAGVIDWINQIGSAGMEFMFGGIGVNAAGEIFATGSFQRDVKFSPDDSLSSAGMWDIFLAKYANDGTLLWYKNVGTGSNVQNSTDLQVDASGDLILTGLFGDSIQIDATNTLYSEDAFQDYFYAKFEPVNGDLVWVRQIKAISHINSGRIYTMEQNSSSYFFAGNYADSIIIEDDTLVSRNMSYDVHLISTDFDGNVNWVRSVRGEQVENSYALAVDENEDVYMAGFYQSDALTVDSNATDTLRVEENNGLYDYFIAKYNNDGNLSWIRTAGGAGNDYIYDATIFDEKVHMAGTFRGDLEWGALTLSTESDNDADSFLGSLDFEGNFRSASNYPGRNESQEEMTSVFFAGERMYSVMRTNSDLITLGDDSYVSSTGKFYLIMGVVGCLPINFDEVTSTETVNCHGDSTGNITITVSAGFGGPYLYSIDDGSGPVSQQSGLFTGLPEGDYALVVFDNANCEGVGPTVNIAQPDILDVVLESSDAPLYWWVDSSFIENGSLTVTASGGKDDQYLATLYKENESQEFVQLGDEQFQNLTFVIADTGSYMVELTNVDACAPVQTGVIAILPDFNVGTEGPRAIDAKVYPNPSSSVVHIELRMNAEEVHMEILSLTGQVVRSTVVRTNGGQLHESVNVSELAGGMYMLRLNGQTVNTRIVVN